jgi:small-conductance mechanosensitive channel
VGVTAGALALRTVAFGRLEAAVTRAPSGPGALLWRALRLPSLLWCLLIGIHWVTATLPLPPRLAGRLEVLVPTLLTLSVTLALADVVADAVARFGADRAMALGVTGLARSVARAAVLAVGGLVLLSGLGVAITPLLTALGVGGLAAARALQDTLANLFAGIRLLADRPVRIGDFVRLENGMDGVVTDIGSRSTRLRTPANALVVIPNTKLAQSIVINYALPDPRKWLTLSVVASGAADPDDVEHALVDEAIKASADVPGLLAEPTPVARLASSPGHPTLELTLTCPVASLATEAAARHELRKRPVRRLRREGLQA